jgi:copper(I)-binding protein
MTKMHELRSLALAAVAACALAACSAAPAKKDGAIAVEQPWVRMPALAGEPGAAYFRLSGGAEGTKLVSVSSPLVRRIELHESMTGGGMASMKKSKDVDFAYDGTITFKPGGRHAMLFGINSAVKPGATLPLTFAFDTAPPVTVAVPVKSAGGEDAADMAAMNHQGR